MTPRRLEFNSTCFSSQKRSIRENMTASKLTSINWEVPWKLVRVPAMRIESEDFPWLWEDAPICITEKLSNDAYEVAMPQSYVQRLELDAHYDPLQPDGGEEAVHGARSATRRARDRFVQRTQRVNNSNKPAMARGAYSHIIRSIQGSLKTECLSYDILVSFVDLLANGKLIGQMWDSDNQQNLARIIIVLTLCLVDIQSQTARNILALEQNTLIDSFQSSLISLRISSERDQAQTILILGRLLELSGCTRTVYNLECGFAPEYTTHKNADLLASILNVPKTRLSNNWDLTEMTTSSPVFTGATTGIQDLRGWITQVMCRVCIGFPEDYLGIPSVILAGSGVGYLESFKSFRDYTYCHIPTLDRPENNMPLLLTWIPTMFSDGDLQFQVVREWAGSADGTEMYRDLLQQFQHESKIEQLTLIMAYLWNYQRLVPDSIHEPHRENCLVDFDKYLGGTQRDSGVIAKYMIVALLRVLRIHGNMYLELIGFLETVSDTHDNLPQPVDSIFDQYWGLRIYSWTHHKAFDAAQLQAREKWVIVPDPQIQDVSQTSSSPSLELEGNRCLVPPPNFDPDRYTLVRLFNARHDDVLAGRDELFGPVNTTPSVLPLGDDSWEVLILTSQIATLKNTLSMTLLGSILDTCYDPLQPTKLDLERWEYTKAKSLCRCWFLQKASWVIRTGWSIPAIYYAHLINLHDSIETAVGPSFSEGSEVPFVATYQGFVQTEKEAVYLVETCIRGDLAYAHRGPRPGEIVAGSNTFVWEANVTDIETWEDSIEWTFQQHDGQQIGLSSDESGLIKRTFAIRACGTTHHVVSYTAQGVTTADEATDQMRLIPGCIRERMPHDLLHYVSKQESVVDVPICEQEPAEITSEVISEKLFELTVYFPTPTASSPMTACSDDSPGGCTWFYLHFKGGICKASIDGDRSWCSHMAKSTRAIYACVHHPSAATMTNREILTASLQAYHFASQLCTERWKKSWGTSPGRMILSGSSFGCTVALSVAAIAAQNGNPAYGLIALVPLLDTNPGYTAWGENVDSLGLTPLRLLSELEILFGEHSGDRTNWRYNPSLMPDQILQLLPRLTMIVATLDPLYKSQIKFRERLRSQGINVGYLEVDGLHMVKDMDLFTEAGRLVRHYVTTIHQTIKEQQITTFSGLKVSC